MFKQLGQYVASSIEKSWYKSFSIWVVLLWPVSLIARVYTAHKFKKHLSNPPQPYSKPVIVIGNLTVGGTGKTPFILWLSKVLIEEGLRVGVVSRGYGGQIKEFPHNITSSDDAVDVGDEPKLIFERLNKVSVVPVMIDPDRDNAVKALLSNYDVDVVLSDDGMQHYPMHRDLEIAIVDGQRKLGNEQLLPAGPLRESRKRLKQVDVLVSTSASFNKSEVMTYQSDSIFEVGSRNWVTDLGALYGRKVHAVAGIGFPKRFFKALKDAGIEVIEHSFKDHHIYEAQDLSFGDDIPIIMTEKDAVKCRKISLNKLWYLPIQAQLSDAFKQDLILRVHRLISSHKSG